MENNSKKLKKCPVCSSSRLKINDSEEIRCEKCGFVHSDKKNACFVEFPWEIKGFYSPTNITNTNY